MTVFNSARLNRAISARGLTYKRFAEVAGITADTLTRAAAGKRVGPGTHLKIGHALLAVPPIPGLEELLDE